MTEPLTVAVIGAGLMGHGIAQAFAARGHAVRITDPSTQALATVRDRVRANLADLGEDGSAAERILPCEDLRAAVEGADHVVEAASEDLAIKKALFAAVEPFAPGAVLASNTSVFPITSIMEDLGDRSRCLGTHWWNPPYLVPLVEVIGTRWTSPEVLARTLDLHRSLGKVAVHVKRDVPGFIGNRMQAALWREAIALVEGGVCSAADVDAVVKASFGRRLAVLGPLENADLIGTDLTLAIHDIVMPHIESRPSASPYLRRLLAEGRLGTKSGRGFRDWSPEDVDRLRRDLNLISEASRPRRARPRSDPAWADRSSVGGRDRTLDHADEEPVTLTYAWRSANSGDAPGPAIQRSPPCGHAGRSWYSRFCLNAAMTH